MNAVAWLRLKILEEKLKFGAFGKYNRYRCWCLERNAKTITEKLSLAREVLSSPGISILESQHNVSYLRKHSTAAKKAKSQPAKENAPAANPELHGTAIS